MKLISLLLALVLTASAGQPKIPFTVTKISDGKRDVVVLQPVFSVMFEVEDAEKLGLAKGEAVVCTIIPFEKKNEASGDVQQTFDLDCGAHGKVRLQRIFLQSSK